MCMLVHGEQPLVAMTQPVAPSRVAQAVVRAAIGVQREGQRPLPRAAIAATSGSSRLMTATPQRSKMRALAAA